MSPTEPKRRAKPIKEKGSPSASTRRNALEKFRRAAAAVADEGLAGNQPNLMATDLTGHPLKMNEATPATKKRAGIAAAPVQLLDTGEFGMAETREPHTPRRRERKGYIQPDRAGKIGVNGFLDPDTHTKYYALAMDSGLTTPQLTTYVLREAVKRAGKDATFRAELAEEAKRIAEEKRQTKKAAVARRNSSIRSVHRIPPPKRTPS